MKGSSMSTPTAVTMLGDTAAGIADATCSTSRAFSGAYTYFSWAWSSATAAPSGSTLTLANHRLRSAVEETPVV